MRVRRAGAYVQRVSVLAMTTKLRVCWVQSSKDIARCCRERLGGSDCLDQTNTSRGYLEHADDSCTCNAGGTDQAKLFEVSCQRIEVSQGMRGAGLGGCPGAGYDRIGVAICEVVYRYQ